MKLNPFSSRKSINPFLDLAKIGHIENFLSKYELNEFMTYLDKNKFTDNVETLYMDSLNFIQRNEDDYFLKTLSLLLLWEFILKKRVNDAYLPVLNNPEKEDVDQENIDKLVFHMATVNNYRITLVDNITEWVIGRFEYANENFTRYRELANSEITKITRIAGKFQKMFKKYFDMKDENQSTTYDDINYTMKKAIEIGNVLFNKTPKGSKFARM